MLFLWQVLLKGRWQGESEKKACYSVEHTCAYVCIYERTSRILPYIAVTVLSPNKISRFMRFMLIFIVLIDLGGEGHKSGLSMLVKSPWEGKPKGLQEAVEGSWQLPRGSPPAAWFRGIQ